MGKKFLVGVGVAVLVVVVLIWQLAANMDAIVAGLIEDVGSDVLKTEVSVSGVAVDLKAGKASIAGLSIANPDGFSRAMLFEMEGIEVDLDIASLSKNVLVIDSILIQNPSVLYEESAGGGNNMQTLLDNIDSAPQDPPPAGSAEEMKLIIDRFEFTGGQVSLDSQAMPEGVTELKLPAVKMSSIGRKQGGVTAAVVTEKIVKELAGEIIAAAARASIDKAVEEKKKGFLDRLKGEN